MKPFESMGGILFSAGLMAQGAITPGGANPPRGVCDFPKGLVLKRRRAEKLPSWFRRGLGVVVRRTSATTPSSPPQMRRGTCQTPLFVEKVGATLTSSLIMTIRDRAGEQTVFVGMNRVILMTKEQQ
jgi:hypothetical protein